MKEDTVRVLRVIEYVGPRKWIEETLAKSIHGKKDCSTYAQKQGNVPCHINAMTLTVYPEILDNAPPAPGDAP